MSVFSESELTYLAKGKLGRLATIDGAGMPHVVPLGWRYNPGLDVIDIGGRDFARSRKFDNAQHNPHVALVVDDVLPPWRPRCVMIRGMAEALTEAAGPDGQPASQSHHPATSRRSDQLGDGVRRGIVRDPRKLRTLICAVLRCAEDAAVGAGSSPAWEWIAVAGQGSLRDKGAVARIGAC
jgi:pyridoxamine 5'-phosphate oxidase family protein